MDLMYKIPTGAFSSSLGNEMHFKTLVCLQIKLKGPFLHFVTLYCSYDIN